MRRHKHKEGRLQEAQRFFQLANVSAMQGKTDEAVTYFERTLALRPDYAEAHTNLGNVFLAQGRIDRAVVHFERALSFMPDARIHHNLGIAYALQRKLDRAVDQHERALALRPDYAEAHNGLGLALMSQWKMDQAVKHFQRAVALQPDFPEAHNNLGLALGLLGKTEQAVALYERALALRPGYTEAHSNLLLALNYVAASDPVAVYTSHRNYAKRQEAALAVSVPAHVNDRTFERRLKIGYVSADFRRHSVAHFIEPVLEHRDRDRFEVFCYYSYPHEDEITQRLKSRADCWRCIFNLSDEIAARQIRADQIDILIDLNGHTSSNRLPVFARKPAPIQVTWLGYPNTTGLAAMDYRLTDDFADPVGMTEHLYSEKLVRLPQCFSCYQPPAEAPEVSSLPARENGYITFGSFNNLAKITPEVMSVWARILQAIPDSRLILKYLSLDVMAVQQSVRKEFMELGIAPERLELLGRDHSQGDHLWRYRDVDIGLDTFPYNGTTTTCDALWMGVPVVTLAGRTHAGRVGVSQMNNLGLTELIGTTPQEYIAAALRLASDLDRLYALRKELRARMAASPLMDGPHFTKNLEQAYLFMWKNWCQKPG
jgi:predicted O-linked N-acetylglucosamine transferase (SPINDLY family)